MINLHASKRQHVCNARTENPDWLADMLLILIKNTHRQTRRRNTEGLILILRKRQAVRETENTQRQTD